MEIIYVSDEAKKIMAQRGITLDSAAPAVELTAAEKLKAFLKARPKRFSSYEEMKMFDTLENRLRNEVITAFWAHTEQGGDR
jgi:hypothetical protein